MLSTSWQKLLNDPHCLITLHQMNESIIASAFDWEENDSVSSPILIWILQWNDGVACTNSSSVRLSIRGSNPPLNEC